MEEKANQTREVVMAAAMRCSVPDRLRTVLLPLSFLSHDGHETLRDGVQGWPQPLPLWGLGWALATLSSKRASMSAARSPLTPRFRTRSAESKTLVFALSSLAAMLISLSTPDDAALPWSSVWEGLSAVRNLASKVTDGYGAPGFGRGVFLPHSGSDSSKKVLFPPLNRMARRPI